MMQFKKNAGNESELFLEDLLKATSLDAPTKCSTHLNQQVSSKIQELVSLKRYHVTSLSFHPDSQQLKWDSSVEYM
jgi:hypothetical protein